MNHHGDLTGLYTRRNETFIVQRYNKGLFFVSIKTFLESEEKYEKRVEQNSG